MSLLGRRGSGGAAVLGSALLAGALAAALLAPSSAAAIPACPKGKVCTDDTGKYTLVVPPLSTQEPYAQYRDCVWQVHVKFGDGTTGDYVYEGEVGIAESHTFPTYGEYTVVAELHDSYHKNAPAEPCLNPVISAEVLYRSPLELAEEEKKEKEEQEEKVAREQKEKEAKELKEREEKEAKEKAAKERSGGSGKPGTGGSQGPDGGAGGPRVAFWQGCRGHVYSHEVACKKARKVIRLAQAKLTDEGTVRVLEFSCHVTSNIPHRIGCRRGKGRVLGPLG